MKIGRKILVKGNESLLAYIAKVKGIVPQEDKWVSVICIKGK